MDPLSITASVVGLLMAGREMGILPQPLAVTRRMAQTVGYEIHNFVVVLSQLQPFVPG